MIQVSPALAVTTPLPARVASPVSGGTKGFARAMADAVAPGAEQADPAVEAKLAGVAGRQKHAAGGKELPVSVDGEKLAEAEADAGGDTDEDEGAADTPFAWFGIAPVAPEPAPIVVKLPVAATSIASIDGDSAAPVPELQVPGGIVEPVGTGVAEIPPQLSEAAADLIGAADAAGGETAPAPASAPAPDTVIKPEFAPGRNAEARASDRPVIELPAGFEPVRPAQRMQVPLAAELTRSDAARPMLAEQMLAGLEGPAQRRAAPRDIALSAMSQALQTDAPRPNIVQAVAQAQQPVLDTSRQQWMVDMIDTVSALRETPNSRETTIRLSPDALGTVDVSIRQEGDRVHVRIVAETPAARQLLNEAQGRLNELAEARGLRLGQTSVETSGGNAAGHGHQRQEQQLPATPIHNRPAVTAEAETHADANARVA